MIFHDFIITQQIALGKNKISYPDRVKLVSQRNSGLTEAGSTRLNKAGYLFYFEIV